MDAIGYLKMINVNGAELEEQGTVEEGGKIVEGQVYTDVTGFPSHAIGWHYRVLRFVPDVPSYQEKVVVEALDGPDGPSGGKEGLWFVCSLANFRTRYRPSPANFIKGVREQL